MWCGVTHAQRPRQRRTLYAIVKGATLAPAIATVKRRWAAYFLLLGLLFVDSFVSRRVVFVVAAFVATLVGEAVLAARHSL